MLRNHQAQELQSVIVQARASIKEAGAVLERGGRRQEERARALRMMNDGLVKLRTLELKLDELIERP